MGDNFDKTASNWTTDLLASRLYAENNLQKNKNNEKNSKKNSKVINTRLQMSQSTPALKTISSTNDFNTTNNGLGVGGSGLNGLNGLERKSTVKTSKIIGDNNRNLLKKSVLPTTSSSTLSSSYGLLPPLDAKQSSHESDIHQNETLSSKPIAPTTFLQSLNLSPKLHHELFHVPHTFFYLQSKVAIDTKAYDLQLISQDKVDKNQYYTISKEGITLHRASDSEFTSLAQWEREFSLFHQISVIPFFRQYRRWKVFIIYYFNLLI